MISCSDSCVQRRTASTVQPTALTAAHYCHTLRQLKKRKTSEFFSFTSVCLKTIRVKDRTAFKISLWKLETILSTLTQRRVR